MRTLAALPVALALLVTGCLGQTAPAPLAPTADVPADPAAAVEPLVQEWQGRIGASPLGALAHDARTEGMVRGIQSEGFLLDVQEPPQRLEVALHWSGPGQALIMVSSPHVDGQGVEYFTSMSGEEHTCLAVPAEGIVPGLWQVMIHTSMAANVDYTFIVTTVGGVAQVLDEPHSAAEAAETTEGEALACETEPA